MFIFLNRILDKDVAETADSADAADGSQRITRSKHSMGGVSLKDVLTLSELSISHKRKSRGKNLRKLKPKPKKSTKATKSTKSVTEAPFEKALAMEMSKNRVSEKFRHPEANMLPPQPYIRAKCVNPSYRHYVKFLPKVTVDSEDLVGKEAMNTMPPEVPLAAIKPLSSQVEDFNSFHITGTPKR